MISKELKCIYIHIPKTAGTSIENKLGHFKTLNFNVQDHRTLKEIESITDRKFQIRKAAYSLKRGKLHRIIPNLKNAISPEITKKEYNEFYKFSIVRNSWARIYSWYNVILRDTHHREKYGVGKEPYSFKTFLTEKMNHEKFSQMNYIQNNKQEIAMDFIGRFENLQEDFNKVAEKLGLEDAKLPEFLVHNYAHYTANYDKETKDLVYKNYKEEIDYFGFEYGE